MSSELIGKIITIGDLKYKVGTKISQNTHSTMYKGESETLKSTVAIRHVSLKITDAPQNEALKKENAFFDRIKPHKNIITLINK